MYPFTRRGYYRAGADIPHPPGLSAEMYGWATGYSAVYDSIQGAADSTAHPPAGVITDRRPTLQTMSRQEFEEEYAKRSGVTIEWLREIGQISLPCNCEEEGCQGWQMRGLATIDICDLQFIPESYRSEVVDLLMYHRWRWSIREALLRCCEG